MATMIIVRGISGSGKSTYVRNNYPEAVCCSADDHFMKDGKYVFLFNELDQAHSACWKKALMTCTSGVDVVIDNTNTQLWEMSPYVMMAKAHGYQLQFVRIVCDPEVAAERNTHEVPEASIRNMHRRMEKLLPFWGKELVVGEE